MLCPSGADRKFPAEKLLNCIPMQFGELGMFGYS